MKYRYTYNQPRSLSWNKNYQLFFRRTSLLLQLILTLTLPTALKLNADQKKRKKLTDRKTDRQNITKQTDNKLF